MEYPDFIAQWRDDGGSIRCFSSGSTGIPKEIQLPKSQMRASARRTMCFFGLDEKAHLHSCISPDYIGGKMMAVRADVTGCRLTWEMPTNRPLQVHDGSPIDLLSVVPSQMLHLLAHRDNLPEIRHILVGGAPVGGRLKELIVDSGMDVWESYGMTETASHIALRRVTCGDEGFRALPGIAVSAGDGERLRIQMEGWQELLTNDIVSIASDGSFTIVGRYDNVIITGGKKVHPEELESKLSAEFGIEVIATGAPDLKWGEKVVLIVEDDALRGLSECCEAETYGRCITDDQLLEFCRNSMPRECVPKQIIRAKLPRTGNGKPDRSAARGLAQAEIDC